MRDPSLTTQPYEYMDNLTPLIVIDEPPAYDRYDFDLADDDDFKKYMKELERTVRGSFEYRQMIDYLHENVEMNKCSYFENINTMDMRKVRIEIHHEPFSLYDICLIVYRKRVAFHESLEICHVAKEVMYHHYNMWVGLIPLSETVHNLVHNGYIFIPCDKVFGHWQEFEDRYKPYMLPEQIDCLDKLKEASRTTNEDYKTLLSKQMIYVDMTGAYRVPELQDVMGAVKGRIHELMDDPVPPERPNTTQLIDPMVWN